MTKAKGKPKGKPKNPITSIHPVIRRLMEIADEQNWKLGDLSAKTGIPPNTLSLLRSPKIDDAAVRGGTAKLMHVDMLALVLGQKIVVVENNDSPIDSQIRTSDRFATSR